ncbi:MAG: CDP-glycerol glycerophosphotransferase family protein [Actinomycetota bacterium]|nr:CDP-glycerol glycerophosphotransferase family protein [Actinomycetota bacterium]
MRIVYSSFDGRFSDSPRAIFELLRQRHPGYEHVWLAHPDHYYAFPSWAERVSARSAASRRLLASADFVVANTYILCEWDKRPDAVYLQTWHGTPYKRIHFDVPWSPPGALDAPNADIARWDWLLSPNALSTDVLRGAFAYSGNMLETGYPRNDVLLSRGRDDVRARVRAELGIPEGTTAVLYTPTWRDDEYFPPGRPDIPVALEVDDFVKRLGEDHCLLVRAHYNLTSRLVTEDSDVVRNVSHHADVAELYLAADMMVTDYSSTMFDFAVTGKPLLFFTYDFEHYRDVLRGFYFDFELEGPGPMLATTGELVDAILDIGDVRAHYAPAYEAFRHRYCHLDDGRATERVIDHFWPA